MRPCTYTPGRRNCPQRLGCVPGTNYWMVKYIDVADANNSRTLNVNIPWNSVDMYQIHAITFPFYPLIPYLHASGHSMDVGEVKNMLFIGTPIEVNHWRNLIQICRCCMCQDWRCCATHLFILTRKWSSLVRKYLAIGIACAA